MAMVTATDMATDTAMDIMATTARGRLRVLLMLSPDMDTTAMDTDMDMATVTDMDTAMVAMDMDMATTVMDMATAMATTNKFLLLFSAVESSVQTKNLDHLVLVLNFKIL